MATVDRRAVEEQGDAPFVRLLAGRAFRGREDPTCPKRASLARSAPRPGRPRSLSGRARREARLQGHGTERPRGRDEGRPASATRSATTLFRAAARSRWPGRPRWRSASPRRPKRRHPSSGMGGDLLQQPLQVAQEPIDRRGEEELWGDRGTPRAGPRSTPRSASPGRGGWSRRHPQPGGAEDLQKPRGRRGARELQREQHLEERVAVQLAIGLHLFHEPLEGQVLMRVGLEGRRRTRASSPGSCPRPTPPRAARREVDEAADQALGLRPRRVGDRAPDRRARARPVYRRSNA